MQIFGLRSPLISLIIYKKCLKQLISQKVHALTRIAPYMATPKRNLLMNPFFISQFSYCYLVWMCHSRLMKNKINRLHEECLRIVYHCKVHYKASFFEELLDKDGSATIHTKNLQVLATETFNVYKNLSPTIVAEIFCLPEEL